MRNNCGFLGVGVSDFETDYVGLSSMLRFADFSSNDRENR